MIITMNSGMVLRFKAAGWHFLFSALLLVGLVLWLWWWAYPAGLFWVQGADRVLLIMALVHLVIGPGLVFAVFKKGKRSLPYDVALITALQCVAFGYGSWVLYQERPAGLVLTLDRFFVVTETKVPTDTLEDRAALDSGAGSVFWAYAGLPLALSQTDQAIIRSATRAPALARQPGRYLAFAQAQSQLARQALTPERAAAFCGCTIPASVDYHLLPVVGKARRGIALVDAQAVQLERIIAGQPH